MAEREADTLARQAVARAAERQANARDAGVQLGLWAEAAPVAASTPVAAPEKRIGRPVGAKNKAKAGLAELLDAHGMRDPGLRLAAMAGLDQPGDVYLVAIARMQVIEAAVGTLKADKRADLVLRIVAEMRLAADALLPYRHGRITPEVGEQAVQTIIQIAAPGSAPGAVTVTGRMGPPPMPGEIVGNQGVAAGSTGQSDRG